MQYSTAVKLDFSKNDPQMWNLHVHNYTAAELCVRFQNHRASLSMTVLPGQPEWSSTWCTLLISTPAPTGPTDGHHFFSRLSAGCLAHRAAWSGTFSAGPGLVPQCDNVHASLVSWQHNTCCQPDPHAPPLGDKGLTRGDNRSHKLHRQCGRTLEDSGTASL